MAATDTMTQALARDTELPSRFTQPGPTESFLRTAPRHLVQDFAETAPAIQADPSWFTAVGPTPGFTPYR